MQVRCIEPEPTWLEALAAKAGMSPDELRAYLRSEIARRRAPRQPHNPGLATVAWEAAAGDPLSALAAVLDVRR